MAARVALLLLHLRFPGSDSLKAKRRRLLPLLARLHKEFNVSAAEVDFRDQHSDALVGCALINTEASRAERSLEAVADWVERHWRDADVVDQQLEILA